MILWLLTTAALAKDAPCDAFVADDWHQVMNQIDAELVRSRLDVASDLITEAQTTSRCIKTVAPSSYVARLAQQTAIVRFFEQDAEETVGWTLAWLASMEPHPWPPSIGDDHPMGRLLEDAELPEATGPERGLAFPKGGGVFLNGHPLEAPRAYENVPGLIQVADKDGTVILAYWQDGPNFREEVLGDEPGHTPKWFEPEDVAAAVTANRQWFATQGPEKLAEQAQSASSQCVLYTEAAFKETARRARTAVDYDDQEAYAEVILELFRELPCLNASMPTETWAKLLVELAIMEHRQGNSWMDPLSTALNIQPNVSRDHAPREIRDWSAPPPGSPGKRLPGDANFYVDGTEVTQVPDLPGLHVVQRHKKGNWETQLLRGEKFPSDWLESTAVADRPDYLDDRILIGHAALVGGFGSANQAPDAAGGDWLPEQSDAGAVVGLATVGHTRFDAAANAFWDVTVPLYLGGGLHADAYAGASFGPLIAGGGVTTVPLAIGGETQTVLVPQPHIGVSVPLDDLRVTAAGGWTTAGLHALAGGTYSTGSLLFGLDASYSRATFVEDGATARDIGVGRLRAGLRVGVLFAAR